MQCTVHADYDDDDDADDDGDDENDEMHYFILFHFTLYFSLFFFFFLLTSVFQLSVVGTLCASICKRRWLSCGNRALLLVSNTYSHTHSVMNGRRLGCARARPNKSYCSCHNECLFTCCLCVHCSLNYMFSFLGIIFLYLQTKRNDDDDDDDGDQRQSIAVCMSLCVCVCVGPI